MSRLPTGDRPSSSGSGARRVGARRRLMNPGADRLHLIWPVAHRAGEVTMNEVKVAPGVVDYSTLVPRAPATRGDTIRITGITTGTLQLKPTFLEGSPAYSDPLGLILAAALRLRWPAHAWLPRELAGHGRWIDRRVADARA